MNSLVLLFVVFTCGSSFVIADFVVQRNVKDYGAVGDGVHDDTGAFIAALTTGKATIPRPGYWNNSRYGYQTTMPSIVRVPPGIYRISDQIPIPYYTQLVGVVADESVSSRPTLLFVTNASTSPSYTCMDAGIDEGPGNGWYGGANQNNFYRQVRNLNIDIRQCIGCTAIHWQVAQATSLTRMNFNLCDACTGIWMESGSGGYMGDLVFIGGQTAMRMGNQQFTLRNITIERSVTGIDLIWGWMWSFFDVRFYQVSTAVHLESGVNSFILTDVLFDTVTHGVLVDSNATQFVVDHAQYVGVTFPIVMTGVVIPNPGKQFGNLRTQQSSWYVGTLNLAPRSTSLTRAVSGKYVGVARPVYNPSNVVTLTLQSGSDVTASLQSQLNTIASQGKVAFLPYGTYLISDTVVVPRNTRLFGEVWSRLMATGPNFSNENSPKAVLQLGTVGDIGVMQLSDLLITTSGPCAGAVLVDWQIAGGAPGDAGMWDVQYRIGGAVGTTLRPTQCPTTAYRSSSSCDGAHTLLHLRPSARYVYLQNVWGWVADHDIDADIQINVYNARGAVIESTGPVWLYGTAMEHSFLFQYNFHHSSNILMTIAQTETPYYQPEFPLDGVVKVPSDPPTTLPSQSPSYDAYSIALQNIGNNVALYGFGLYSFFVRWNTTCPGNVCQQNIFLLTEQSSGTQAPDGFTLLMLNTHASANVLGVLHGNSTLTQYNAQNFKNGFCETLSYWSGPLP